MKKSSAEKLVEVYPFASTQRLLSVQKLDKGAASPVGRVLPVDRGVPHSKVSAMSKAVTR